MICLFSFIAGCNLKAMNSCIYKESLGGGYGINRNVSREKALFAAVPPYLRAKVINAGLHRTGETMRPGMTSHSGKQAGKSPK
jgi:hypothetical protein